jgi:hypothetical protein
MDYKLFRRRRKKPKESSRIIANVSEIFVLRYLGQLSLSVDDFPSESTDSVSWSQGCWPGCASTPPVLMS